MNRHVHVHVLTGAGFFTDEIVEDRVFAAIRPRDGLKLGHFRSFRCLVQNTETNVTVRSQIPPAADTSRFEDAVINFSKPTQSHHNAL